MTARRWALAGGARPGAGGWRRAARGPRCSGARPPGTSGLSADLRAALRSAAQLDRMPSRLRTAAARTGAWAPPPSRRWFLDCYPRPDPRGPAAAHPAVPVATPTPAPTSSPAQPAPAEPDPDGRPRLPPRSGARRLRSADPAAVAAAMASAAGTAPAAETAPAEATSRRRRPGGGGAAPAPNAERSQTERPPRRRRRRRASGGVGPPGPRRGCARPCWGRRSTTRGRSASQQQYLEPLSASSASPRRPTRWSSRRWTAARSAERSRASRPTAAPRPATRSARRSTGWPRDAARTAGARPRRSSCSPTASGRRAATRSPPRGAQRSSASASRPWPWGPTEGTVPGPAGEPIPVPPDPATLREISRITGGTFTRGRRRGRSGRRLQEARLEGRHQAGQARGQLELRGRRPGSCCWGLGTGLRWRGRLRSLREVSAHSRRIRGARAEHRWTPTTRRQHRCSAPPSASPPSPSPPSARSVSAAPPSPARPTTTASPAAPQAATAAEALSSDVAAKVKAAALDKVPGATVLRTEAGGPYNSAYHAHIKTSDGTLKVVLVTPRSRRPRSRPTAAAARPGGPGGPRHGGPGAGETALTGDTKEKVEAAVLAKYAGATIVRTETNGDSSRAVRVAHHDERRQGARGPREQGLRGRRRARAPRAPVARPRARRLAPAGRQAFDTHPRPVCRACGRAQPVGFALGYSCDHNYDCVRIPLARRSSPPGAGCSVHAAVTRRLDAQMRAEHGLPALGLRGPDVPADAPDGRMRMSEIADRVLLSRSALTRLVDRLAALGSSSAARSTEDGRGAFAQITAAGRERFDRGPPDAPRRRPPALPRPPERQRPVGPRRHLGAARAANTSSCTRNHLIWLLYATT